VLFQQFAGGAGDLLMKGLARGAWLLREPMRAARSNLMQSLAALEAGRIG